MIFYGELCGIIGWAINLVSYHRNNMNKLLLMQIIGSIFFCIGYLLLGAYSGLFICFFELIKMYAHYKSDKDNLIFLCSIPVYILIALYTCNTFLDYLPVIASIIDSYTISKKIKTAVFGGFLSYSLWFIYDIFVYAYASALTDLFIVISNASILITYVKGFFLSKEVKISSNREINKSTFERIVQIDIENFGNSFIWPVLYQQKIYLKNKESFMIISNCSKVVGYLNYLVIKESEFNNIISSAKYTNKSELENIKKFSKKGINYLQIESISVEKRFQNKIIENKIKTKFISFIRKKIKSKYKIGGVVSFACSDFEKGVLEEMNFKKIYSYPENISLYLLDSDKINELLK